MYTMLIGSPGTKKSSAIKIGAKLLEKAGYTNFAAKKTRQEKFLADLADFSVIQDPDAYSGSDILDQNIFGDGVEDIDRKENYAHKPPSECFVAADEFNNFIGLGNTDFISILGELWDYEGVYDYKLKNSKSIFIPNPTVTILGGNTPTGFAQAFPADTIGQGFFSRLLLIYGEPSGVKFTFPPPPDIELQEKLIAHLHYVKDKVKGEVTMTPEATDLLDKIYIQWEGIEDLRFEHYANRRLTHLLKLCIVIAASNISTQITYTDVVHANTLLTFTEQLMPKALGEFGRARNAEVAHKVMAAIDNATVPIPLQGIWKIVHNDLDNRESLANIIGNLQAAEKIQYIDLDGASGYLPIKKTMYMGVKGSVDWSILTETERDLI